MAMRLRSTQTSHPESSAGGLDLFWPEGFGGASELFWLVGLPKTNIQPDSHPTRVNVKFINLRVL